MVVLLLYLSLLPKRIPFTLLMVSFIVVPCLSCQRSEKEKEECEVQEKSRKTLEFLSNAADGTCGRFDSSKEFIIEGEDAPRGGYPWQAYVRTPTAHCGGTLIFPQWVLTAAHCVYGMEVKTVGVGLHHINEMLLSDPTPPAQTFTPELVVHHKDYDPELAQNDVALIKLPKKVKLSRAVSPACIPYFDNNFQDAECFATGWGDTFFGQTFTTDTLQEIKMQVLADSECSSRWQHAIKTEKQMCARSGEVNKRGGLCSGDSGGPLSCMVDGKVYVAGVASFVSKNCSGKYPDVFVRVSYYLNWISEIILKNMKTKKGA